MGKESIAGMVDRLQGGTKNPLRFALIEGVYVPWTHKAALQARIDNLERKLKNVKDLKEATPA